MDGCPAAVIASRLGIPEPLARSRLKAAREALRKALVSQLEADRRAEAGEGRQGPALLPGEDGALAALPPRQREVLRLSREGYRPAQIARALDISPNTARVNLYHARKRLRGQPGAA